ncbi:MAG TPA: aminoglycoside phosphotransferase family protein [Acidimicrobiia bacterium]|nr:aminoglycoside phosphotransferase family protein [Acidimicrobiia bacterium]
MGASEMVAGLVPTATVKELSSGTNKVFRLLEESGQSTVVKVYATPARERRERHALEALLGVPGVPQILERGATDGLAWIRTTDGGSWSLASLPLNLDLVRKAGTLLRGVHDSGALITNLDSGIDGDYVQTHFRSTLDRLERYRRRLGLPAEVLEAARRSDNHPVASAPKPAHTRTLPKNFLVNDKGELMLVGWEWATLAPPEWDLSLATWRFSRTLGNEAATALWEGYGGVDSIGNRLEPWVAYHAAMQMLEAAEQRDGRLGDLAYLVNDLAAAVKT